MVSYADELAAEAAALDAELEAILASAGAGLSEAELQELHALIDSELAVLSQDPATFDSEVPANPLERKEWARGSLSRFRRAYLPHYRTIPDADFHAELDTISLDVAMCQGEYAARKGFIGAAPRNHGKSVIITLTLALYCVCYRIKRFIIVFSDTDTPQAKTHASHIKEEFENNARIREDFGDLVGDHHGFKWGEQSLECVHMENGYPAWKTRIISRGIFAKVRGLRYGPFRPDLAIVDDSENDKNVLSMEQRNQLEMIILRTIMPSLDPVSGRLMMVGTIFHMDAVLKRFLDRGEGGGSRFVTRMWKAIDADGKVLWPQRYSYADLMAIKEENPWVFNTEYQNNPVDEQARIFRPERIGYYTLDDLTVKQEDDKLIWLYRGIPLTMFGYADPSIKEKEKNDEFALIIGGVTQNRSKLIVFDVFNDRIDFARQIDLCAQYVERYHLRRIGIEAVAYQESLPQMVRRRLRHHARVRSITRHGKKYERIKALSPMFENGSVLLRSALPDENGYLDELGRTRIHHSMWTFYQQLVMYPNTKFDDMLDAFEGLVYMSGGVPAFAPMAA